MSILDDFRRLLPSTGRALHMGTLRYRGRASDLDRRKAWFPPDWEHVGTDIQAGFDVDVVADAHNLCKCIPAHSFDAITNCSTFEHFARPWLVPWQMSEVTRPGGLVYVQTHQSYPLHEFPGDYFRFSAEALKVLFGPAAGWETLVAGYEFPCEITPRDTVHGWDHHAIAYLNSCCLARRNP